MKFLAQSIFAVLIMANTIFYIFNWGGDPEIHIIFAQNLLDGHLLQFNPGEYTSGETSPLYAIIISSFIYLLPNTLVPYIMKLLGVLSACIVAHQLYKHARFLGFDRSIAVLPASVWFTYPFVVFQAALGMENMLFAACVVVLLRILLEKPFLINYMATSAVGTVTVVVLFLLRPEAIFLGFALGLILLKRRLLGNAFILMFAPAIIIGLLWTIEQQTGAPLHGAGYVRALLSAAGGMQWDVFGVSGAISLVPFRILVYTYFVIGFSLIGATFSETEEKINFDKDFRILAFMGIILAPILLHIFCVLPVVHFSRLTLYVMASILLLAIPWFLKGVEVAQFSIDRALTKQSFFSVKGSYKWLMSIIIGILCIGHFGVENYARYQKNLMWFQRINTHQQVEGVVEAVWNAHLSLIQGVRPRYKQQFSDALCHELNCNPNEKTVVLLQEVQLRLRLDDRFVVRSTDGIVDYVIRRFWGEGSINMVEYIKYRDVDYVFEFPEYAGQLAQLKSAASGTEVVLQGVRFTMMRSKVLNSKIAKVNIK